MATSDSTSKQATCSVYVIRAKSGAVKIGIAKNVNARLRELQTGNHEDLTLLYKLEVASREIALAVETVLHKRYAEHALRGEWFTVGTDRLIDDMQFLVTFAKLVKSMTVEEKGRVTHYRKAKPEPKTPRVRKDPEVITTTDLLNQAQQILFTRGSASFSELQTWLNVDEDAVHYIFDAYLKHDMARVSEDDADVLIYTGQKANFTQKPSEVLADYLAEGNVWTEAQPLLSDDYPADGAEDEVYEQAVELVRRLGKASVALLQRRLRLGYSRAANLIDAMEANGVIAPYVEGSPIREVLP